MCILRLCYILYCTKIGYHCNVIQWTFLPVLIVIGVFCLSTRGISSLWDGQKFHEIPGCECLQTSYIVEVTSLVVWKNRSGFWLQRSGWLGISLGIFIFYYYYNLSEEQCCLSSKCICQEHDVRQQSKSTLSVSELFVIWFRAEGTQRLTGALDWKLLWPTSVLFCRGLFFLLWHNFFMI